MKFDITDVRSDSLFQFLRKYDDKFEFYQATSKVYLKNYTTSPRVPQIVVDQPQEERQRYEELDIMPFMLESKVMLVCIILSSSRLRPVPSL